MPELKDKKLEELYKIRNDLVSAYIIQKSEYQIEQLEKVDKEIKKKLVKENK